MAQPSLGGVQLIVPLGFEQNLWGQQVSGPLVFNDIEGHRVILKAWLMATPGEKEEESG